MSDRKDHLDRQLDSITGQTILGSLTVLGGHKSRLYGGATSQALDAVHAVHASTEFFPTGQPQGSGTIRAFMCHTRRAHAVTCQHRQLADRGYNMELGACMQCTSQCNVLLADCLGD